MSKHRVVIVGGGFSGVKTALELADDQRFEVTIISDHDDFRVYPTLYHVSTGGAKRVSSIPLSEIFVGKSVRVVIDSVTDLDRKARTVTTATGQILSYEALVLGLGVKTNYFHIEGLDQFSFGIKTPADAEALKKHLHQQLCDENKPDLNYVVIGGGPTGIELAGALPAYIKKIAKQHDLKPRKIHVDLVEAAPRLVPRMPKDISLMIARNLRKQGVKIYLKTAVQAQTADALMVNNKPIRSHTVIWTAGVMNSPFFAEHEFQLARNNKVRVDQFLQAEPGIYVVGDNADTPYSGMAQTALYDGKFVAANLQRIASLQDPKPYVAKKPVYVLPAGPKWAAVLWGKVRLYGFPGWILRSLADLLAYHDYMPWKMATERWIALGDHEESCEHCDAEFAKLNYLSGGLSK
jgi:NADH:ubiquinone reductase (H+-translocating)